MINLLLHVYFMCSFKTHPNTLVLSTLLSSLSQGPQSSIAAGQPDNVFRPPPLL